MDYTFTIIDKNTGQVVHEGVVTGIHISKDMFSIAKKYSIEGVELIKVSFNNGSFTVTLPSAQSIPICNHQWAHYTGLFEVEEYCSLCNTKKT